MFDSAVITLGGARSLTETMGLETADVVVVETDGTHERADSLKPADDGAPGHWPGRFPAHPRPVGRLSRHRRRQHGLDDLGAECRACPVVRSCGGGLFAHRYWSDDTGFDNPAVFCVDLKELTLSIDAQTLLERDPSERGRGTWAGDGMHADSHPN